MIGGGMATATGAGAGGYSVRTTQNTAKWEMTTTMSVPIETDRISWSSMFVCSSSFVETEQTAMQINPIREKEGILDARVDGLYRIIKGRIQWDNIIPTCIEVAKEIEGLTHLKGAEKLDLLQKTLRHALKESDESPEEKERILFVVDTVVPLAMQAAIMASKSPILGQVTTACIGCWTK